MRSLIRLNNRSFLTYSPSNLASGLIQYQLSFTNWTTSFIGILGFPLIEGPILYVDGFYFCAHRQFDNPFQAPHEVTQ